MFNLNVPNFPNEKEKYQVFLKPKGKISETINGFAFDIPKEQEITVSQDITDHWVESGEFVHDHITKKPIEITISGQLAELVSQKNSELSKISDGIKDNRNRVLSLTEIYGSPLGPAAKWMTTQAKQVAMEVLREAQIAAEIASNADQRVNRIINKITTNRITDAYGKLMQLYSENILFEVLTEWGATLDNMAITEISCTTNEDTGSILDVSISLKQLRIVDEEVTAANLLSDDIETINKIQMLKPVNLGEVQTKEISKSKAKELTDWFTRGLK